MKIALVTALAIALVRELRIALERKLAEERAVLVSCKGTERGAAVEMKELQLAAALIK